MSFRTSAKERIGKGKARMVRLLKRLSSESNADMNQNAEPEDGFVVVPPHDQDGEKRDYGPAAVMFQRGENVSIHDSQLTVVGRDQIIGVQHNHIGSATGSKENDLFIKLNPVPAAHDCEDVTSKVWQCFHGTRQQLLSDIEDWVTHSSPPIFILDGIAGIGKTTIANSVSIQAAKKQLLGASFFFSRDHDKRRTAKWFIATIAFQLAKHHPYIRDRIVEALHEHPDVFQKELDCQFVTLIVGPLKGIPEENPLVITIDALDECKPREAVALLSTMLTHVTKVPALRIFLTCRPERDIRNLLQRYSDLHIFHLHDIEDSIVESDIRLYINHRLSPAEVIQALPDLRPPPWRPVEIEVDQLVRITGKLFIIASTSIDFILDCRRSAPARQFQKLFEIPEGNFVNPMDRLYIQVLLAALPSPIDDWFDLYQRIVGAIVTIADVLPVESLAELLGLEANDIIGTLTHLHSILPPSGNVYTVHHKSFPDFITDQARCSVDRRFYIHPQTQHLSLAESCLRTMDRGLKQNICDLPLEDWYKDFVDLPPKLRSRIPNALAYACLYWAFHLEQAQYPSEGEIPAITDLLQSFTQNHLLSWFESLAILGSFDIAWSSLRRTSEILGKLYAPSVGLRDVLELLKDGMQFISLHPGLISSCPMHIYLSVLPFVPSRSKISSCYPLPRGLVKVVSVVDPSWDQDKRVSIIHPRSVKRAVFSPDGSKIATVDVNGVTYMWDTYNGSLLLQFPRETLSHIVAFSVDGLKLSGVERSGEVRVWDATTGVLLSHQVRLGTTALPSSTTSATWDSTSSISRFTSETSSVSQNQTSRPSAFTAATSTSVARPSTRGKAPTCAVFSTDGKYISVGDARGTIHIWDVGQENCLVATTSNTLPCSCTRVQMVHSTFTPVCRCKEILDIGFFKFGSLVAISETYVDFWETNTPQLIRRMGRSWKGRTSQASVSSELGMLAVAMKGHIIQIYDFNSVIVSTLLGHSVPVTALTFSPQSKLLSAALGAVRLWDIRTSTCMKVFPVAGLVCKIQFTPRLQSFVLFNDGGNIQRWDIDGKKSVCVPHRDTGARPWKLASDLAVSPDGLTFTALPTNGFSTSNAGLTLHDVSQLAPSTRRPYPTLYLHFSPSGERAVSMADSLVTLCRITNPSCPATSIETFEVGARRTFAYSGDASIVALLSNEFSIQIWDANEANLLKSYQGRDMNLQPSSMALSFDGKQVAFKGQGDSRRVIYVWDVESDTDTPRTYQVPVVTAYIINASSLVFSRNGSKLAINSAHHGHVLDLDTGSFNSLTIGGSEQDDEKKLLRGNLAFSQDGSIVFGTIQCRSLGRTGTICAWSTTSRCPNIIATTPILVNPEHRHRLFDVWSPQFLEFFQLGDTFVLVARSWETIAIVDAARLVPLAQFNIPRSMTLLSSHSFTALDHLVLVKRTNPNAPGLILVKLRVGGEAECRSLCWFPPRFQISRMSVNRKYPLIVVGGKSSMPHTPPHVLYLDVSGLGLQYEQTL